jgi:hypothetical protein
VRLTRRQFIAATAGAAAGAAIPEAVLKWAGQAALATAGQGPFFFNATRMATCAAICSRLVPTGADPTTDPGATEAQAAVFIDRFLASFQELPASIASNSPDNAAIWLQGPYSGRNPFPDNVTGEPSSTFPGDDMLNSSGQMQLIPLNRIRRLTWKAQLYGADAVKGEPNVPTGWAQQIADGTIPGVVPGGLRQLYANGLDAFDSWSRQITMQPFASASPNEQDLMLSVAGNVVVDGVGPNLPALPVAPPPAAEALFPTLLRDTFAGCYGLPEYRGLHSNPLWALIGYDGDTQPLGNSIYGKELAGDNDGFGDDIYTLTGGYNEYRPVSYPDPDSSVLTSAQIDQLMSMLAKKAQSQ